MVVVTCAVVRLGSRIQHILPESYPKNSPPSWMVIIHDKRLSLLLLEPSVEGTTAI